MDAFNKAAAAALHLKYVTHRGKAHMYASTLILSNEYLSIFCDFIDMATAYSKQFELDIDKFIRYIVGWIRIKSVSKANNKGKIRPYRYS